MKIVTFDSSKYTTVGIVSLIIASAVSCSQKPEHDRTYLSIVETYANTLIEHGRDTYGAESSPLFASALDREKLALPEGASLAILQELDHEEWGIRRNDRTLSGANVMHQQNLYQLLYGLSKLTGDQKYAREADKAFSFFLENCQSPATGLFVWGEHMGWDFRTDTVMQHYNEIGHSVGAGMTHEFYRPWVLWNKFFELNPKASESFSLGLWEHQIYDHETGNFSRHAKWDRHAPGRNSEYPRHGGFYIATWAEAYRRTHNPVFLKAIETILDFFETNASKESGAILAEVGNERSKNMMMWPLSNVSLAVDLWDASEGIPDTLAKRLRERASKTDAIFLRMEHDLSENGAGFIDNANVHTLKAEVPASMGGRVRTSRWATGYGKETDAQAANMCYLRYVQVKNEDEGYKDLILATARRYVNSQPDTTAVLYPGTFGDVIFLMLAAHELTGDKMFLDRADYYARHAISTFFRDGSTLPAASSRHDHFESITREDTLMMALLKLYAAKNGKSAGADLVWCDR